MLARAPAPVPHRDRLPDRLGDIGLGLLAALGQAPWGLWPVSLVALALVIWRIASAPRHGMAARRVFRAGCGYFGLAMFWIIEPFFIQPEVHGWMAPFALLLTAAGGALFWTVPVWLASRLSAGSSHRALAAAAALVLSDWIRGWLFTGLPWALTGHIWINTPAGQFAALGGGIGLSALTLLAAALPAWLWRPATRGPWRSIRGAGRGATLALLLIALAWSYGLARLSVPLPADRDIILRLVQPNARQDLKWDPYWSGVFFQRLIDLSSGPTAAGRPPDAVIWPETAVNFPLEQAEDAPRLITEAIGAPVFLGIQRSENGRYFNSFAEFTATGSIGQSYDKFHLVPFGEYIPWGDALARVGITAFAAQLGNGYSAGPGPRVLHDLGGDLPPAQVLICYEAIFPQHLITSGANRPEWLVQITNDAWFGTISGPWQHLAQARQRAIESGLPMLRVANTGISAVIDARGGLRQTLALDSMGRIDTALPAALPPTVHSITGDWPAVLAALLALLWAGGMRMARNSRPGCTERRG